MNNTIKSILVLGLFFSGLGSAFAQTKVDPNFELYILIGQSNMAGRGLITPEFRDVAPPQVWMLAKDNQWVPAKHPLHFDKPKSAGLGPGLAFGIDMAEENPGVKIGLIPCAVGGTPIEHWEPGAFDQATKTHPYDDAMLRIKAAMKYGIIKGIIWHQGEANSSPQGAKFYLTKLDSLIQRIRAAVGNPRLPFVVGELGRYRERYALINAELAKVPALIPYAELASSAGLVHKGDSTHFDGPSANLLGQRFAEKMKELQKIKKLP